MLANMENVTDEEVPGMAQVIAARMAELGLTPGELAKRSGLTPQGIIPIRKGYRRNYEARTKYAIADALGWERDAIDRLLDGQAPEPVAPALSDAAAARLETLEEKVDRLLDIVRQLDVPGER